MDFQEMMDAANRNVKKASKEMGRIEGEVKKEKSAAQQQLENEKRIRMELQRRKAEKAKEMEKRKEEERRKNFTIPRKNEQPSGGVNQNALKAYYEKQEKEKREKEIKAERDRDHLMKLRMQANGGKATKKMGKHFGLDPVELQIRFGGNNEHVETLQKRKWKEEEDADLEADKLRNGVFKALQTKRKHEEMLRANVKGPHRVSTSKSNSLAGLCSRHHSTRDTFSPPKDGKKPKVEEKKKEEKKKVQLAAPVDFKSLMAAASNISQGKKVDVSHLQKPLKREESRPREQRKEQVERERIREKSREKPKMVEKRPIVRREEEKRPAPKKEEEKKREQKGRFVKGPTPPPLIPAAIPGKKYLPGDIRYKQSQSQSTSNGASSSSSSSQNKERISNVRDNEKMREAERERQRKLKRQRQERDERDEMEMQQRRREKMRKMEKMRSESRRYESRREAEMREEQLREKYGIKSRKNGSSSGDRGSSSFCRGADDYSDAEDDYEEDDDYDSEMDDFIDDTEMDMDGMSRKEFEDTLKMVNRKYDKNKWSQREKQISERDMVSDYRRIQSEENFSKRAGYIEDLKEASKGRSVRL